MKKIAIITLFYKNYNYGGVLQALCLQQILKDLGYYSEVLLLDRSHMQGYSNSINNRLISKIKGKLKNVKDSILNKNSTNPYYKSEIEKKIEAYDDFMTKYFVVSDKIYSDENISEISDSYDYYITGSDQVFSPVSGREATLLSFVKDDKKKIAYAASIGADNIDEDYRAYLASYTGKIYYLSVREQSAQKILPNSKLVLDPTVFYGKKISNFETPVSGIEDNSYALLYFLGESDTAFNRALDYAKSLNIDIYNLPFSKMIQTNRDIENQKYNLSGIGPDNFLWLIHHAHIILTDSFHGVAISILYHKQFIVYDREAENSNGVMSDRINTLLHEAGIYTGSTNQDIDYSDVDNTLVCLRRESMDFLKASINGESK